MANNIQEFALKLKTFFDSTGISKLQTKMSDSKKMALAVQNISPYKKMSDSAKYLGQQLEITKLSENALNKSIINTKNSIINQTNKFHDAKTKLSGLRIECDKTGVPTKKLASEINKCTSEIDREKYSLEQLGNTLKNQRNQLVQNTQQIKKMGEAYDFASKKSELSERHTKSLQKTANAYLSIKGTVYAAEKMIGKPLEYAVEAENLEIQIKKQSHTLQDYQEILKKTNAMKVPVSKTAKYHVVEEAMMGGIKDPQKLADFTQLTIKSAQAMQTELHETEKYFLSLNNSLKLENVEQLSKVVNQAHTLRETAGLGKGGELELFDAVNRTAPLLQGAVKNIDTGQLLAYLTTMKQAGVATEVAATSLNSMVISIADISKNKGAHADALEKLKLDSVGLAKMLQKNPLETILMLMKRINALPPIDKLSVTKNMFGQSSIQGIAPLLNGVENLQKNIEAVTNTTMYAGRIDKEYAIQMGTTSSQIQLLKNNYVDIATQVGTMFLPTLKRLVDIAGNFLEVLKPIIENHQTFSTVVGGVVASLFGFSIAIKGIIFAFSGLTATYTGTIKGVNYLKDAYTKFMPTITKAISASWAFTTSLLANPITWIVIGIAAAAAALYLFFTKTEIGKKMWSNMVDYIVSRIETWKQRFNDLVVWLMDRYEAIKNIINKVKNTFGLGNSSNDLNININDKTNLSTKIDELNKNAKAGSNSVINYNYTSNIKAEASDKDKLAKVSQQSYQEAQSNFIDTLRQQSRLGFQ